MGHRASQVGWGALAGLFAVLALRGGSHDPEVRVANRPSVSVPTTLTTVPEPSPTLPSIAPTTVPTVSVWDRLAACLGPEGNGRLHWPPNLWVRHRGEAPADVRAATWDQEQAAANDLLTETGGRFTAWPECAQRLGLPR